MSSHLPFSASLTPPPPLGAMGEPSLFLDFDGTLASIEMTPSDVKFDRTRISLLLALSERLDGRLAIVSGRTIAGLDAVLLRQVVPMAGVHGLQRRNAFGIRTDAPVHNGLAVARAVFEDISRNDDGIILEDKGCSIAIHYRRVPEV